QFQVGFDLAGDTLVIFTLVEAVFERAMPAMRGNRQPVLFDQRPVFLRDEFYGVVADVGSSADKGFGRHSGRDEAPPRRRLFQVAHSVSSCVQWGLYHCPLVRPSTSMTK